MATISVIKPTEDGTHPTRMSAVKVPYTVERVIDVAELVAAKGSALAAADVIEVFKVPAHTVVLGAFIGKVEASNATTLTFDVVKGSTDFITGYNAQAAAVNSVATGIVSPSPRVVTNRPDDVVSIEIATLTGALTTGKFRVIGYLTDISEFNSNPGIAALGS